MMKAQSSDYTIVHETDSSDTETFIPRTSSAGSRNNSSTMRNQRKSTKKSRYLNTVICSTVVIAVIFVVLQFWNIEKNSPKDVLLEPQESVQPVQTAKTEEVVVKYPRLALPKMTPEDYEKLCFPALANEFSISGIERKLLAMLQAKPEPCREVGRLFNRIYRIQHLQGSVKLPGPFVEEVKGWLNNDSALFAKIGTQDIFKVTNKAWGESSVFNMLRSKRPVSKPSVDPVTYVEQVYNSTKASCDFCKYRDHTAEDVFGRIESKYSASASNTFKLAKFHGLLFPKDHHPLNISLPVLQDLFLETLPRWIKKAQEVDPKQVYATLLWDTLPHAGASQIHPHVHGLLDTDQYEGQFGLLQERTVTYFQKYRSYLWADLLLVHWALGLVVQQNSAVAIVPITARKDHEYMIISNTLDKDVTVLLWRIMQAYRNDLSTFCFSSGASLPLPDSVTNGSNLTGLPFIYRIGSRGDCTSVRSDVSSLELYTVNNINSDLAVTLKALKKSKIP